MHGATAKVRAKAAVRAELMAWGLDDVPNCDPSTTLLRLISQSRTRVELLSGLLEEQYVKAEAGDAETTLPARIGALIGREYQLTNEGRPVPVKEAIRALVQLEAAERDRLAKFCSLAINAGLMEKQIAVSERVGAQVADMLRLILGDPTLALTPAQRAAFPGVLRRHLSLAEPAVTGHEGDVDPA